MCTKKNLDTPDQFAVFVQHVTAARQPNHHHHVAFTLTPRASALPSAMIRKSAYGRTELFLPSKGTILREVKCMGGGVGRHNRANIYHVLPSMYDVARSVSCWHCCEAIDDATLAIPLPRIFENDVYHVYGITCSPGCAKAYILEHTSFDRGQQLNVLTHMLRAIYGITHAVLETPPRAALLRFGGPFDPRVAPKTECKLVQPPFVSYCMLVEERSGPHRQEGEGDAALAPILRPAAANSAIEEVDSFDEPFPPALYNTYVERQQGDQEQGQPQKQRQRHQQPQKKSAVHDNDDASIAPKRRLGAIATTTTTTTTTTTQSARATSPLDKKSKLARRQGPLSKFVN